MEVKLSFLLVVLLLVRWFAENEGSNDAFRANRLRRIDHGANLERRLWIGGVMFVLFAALWCWLIDWRTAALIAPFMWGTWTMLFREKLNDDREPRVPRWYMGPALEERGSDDSWYDLRFHQLAKALRLRFKQAPFMLAIILEGGASGISMLLMLLIKR